MQYLVINIKEDSWLARIAAFKLRSTSGTAIVIGNTIYLHNATASQLISNKSWFQHELAHVLQYRQLGLLNFLWSYILESIKNGYHNNKFEVEARSMEYIDFKNLSYQVWIK